jgi:hypothetical protein
MGLFFLGAQRVAYSYPLRVYLRQFWQMVLLKFESWMVYFRGQLDCLHFDIFDSVD